MCFRGGSAKSRKIYLWQAATKMNVQETLELVLSLGLGG